MPHSKSQSGSKNAGRERPSDSQASDAVHTLLSWIGEDADREGLAETPKRVLKAFRSYFAGYGHSPEEILSKTFSEVEGYDDLVVLAGIRFESHCEHHLAPFIGEAAIGYLPGERVVGLSKLARLVDLYAKRLQIQERLTAQIAQALEDYLSPKGTAVLIQAEHMCLSCRGAHKPGAKMTTSCFSGRLRDDPMLQNRFFRIVAES